jgi:sulfur carrier protein
MTDATIRVNGEQRPLRADSVTALLDEMAIDPAAKGVAVAVNGAVAPRAAWSTTRLRGDDVVEIVRPLAGG